MDSGFNDFGELYRAAYAEVDYERKLFLLSAVQQAIEEWRRAEGKESTTAIRVPSTNVSPSRQRSRPAA